MPVHLAHFDLWENCGRRILYFRCVFCFAALSVSLSDTSRCDGSALGCSSEAVTWQLSPAMQRSFRSDESTTQSASLPRDRLLYLSPPLHPPLASAFYFYFPLMLTSHIPLALALPESAAHGLREHCFWRWPYLRRIYSAKLLWIAASLEWNYIDRFSHIKPLFAALMVLLNYFLFVPTVSSAHPCQLIFSPSHPILHTSCIIYTTT